MLEREEFSKQGGNEKIMRKEKEDMKSTGEKEN
jgi:hypothetical protein